MTLTVAIYQNNCFQLQQLNEVCSLTDSISSAQNAITAPLTILRYEYFQQYNYGGKIRTDDDEDEDESKRRKKEGRRKKKDWIILHYSLLKDRITRINKLKYAPANKMRHYGILYTSLHRK